VSRVVRRLAVCLAFSTCCFLASWVALGTGPNVYFARWGPLYTIVIPVLLLEGVLTLGLFGVWELFRYWGWHRAIAAHLLFLAACTAPLGLALAGSLQALPSVAGRPPVGVLGESWRNPETAHSFALCTKRFSDCIAGSRRSDDFGCLGNAALLGIALHRWPPRSCLAGQRADSCGMGGFR
jgi:hypothetical protein